MSFAIKAEGISKVYKIGAFNAGGTLRDSINDLMTFKWKKSPVENFWALKDIDFELKKGDALGIIGRNGAGKSTLLKILSRTTAPTSGCIDINGSIASLLEVGTGFHPELSGRENIFLNGAILGMSRKEIKKKFDAIVDFSEIEKFLDTPVKRYSSGMYVRLAFAVAAHLEPEILIVDEVLAVGDLNFQKKCLGKMSDVGKEGRTVIFVSHNMSAVKALCNRAIYLENGRKEFEGDVLTAVSKYQGRTDEKQVVKIYDSLGPSTKSAQIRKIEIGDASNEEKTEFSTEKPLEIKITFLVEKENAKIGTTVFLNNSDGEMLFASLSNHEEKWHGKNRPIGTYINTCEIPPNLLSDGDYSISVGLWEGFYEQGFIENNVINFSVHEEGFIRGDVPYDSRSGLIKPLLKWQSIKVK
jgi:lipopolysaccharide transport system ATP-binding protein